LDEWDRAREPSVSYIIEFVTPNILTKLPPIPAKVIAEVKISVPRLVILVL
jgi:hypothetical protein